MHDIEGVVICSLLTWKDDLDAEFIEEGRLGRVTVGRDFNRTVSRASPVQLKPATIPFTVIRASGKQKQHESQIMPATVQVKHVVVRRNMIRCSEPVHNISWDYNANPVQSPLSQLYKAIPVVSSLYTLHELHALAR